VDLRKRRNRALNSYFSLVGIGAKRGASLIETSDGNGKVVRVARGENLLATEGATKQESEADRLISQARKGGMSREELRTMHVRNVASLMTRRELGEILPPSTAEEQASLERTLRLEEQLHLAGDLLSDETQERIEARRANGLPVGNETEDEARRAWKAARFEATMRKVEEVKERMGLLPI
jgi:hypothetical protein